MVFTLTHLCTGEIKQQIMGYWVFGLFPSSGILETRVLSEEGGGGRHRVLQRYMKEDGSIA
jgi:hypothetical protein